MKRALVLVLLAACGDGRDPPTAPALTRPAAHQAVVAEAIAALERELRETPAAAYEGDDLEPRVDGLVAGVASSKPAMRRLMLEELARIGAPAVPVLTGLLLDRETPAAERRAAAQALAAVDTPGSAEALLAKVESSRSDEDPERWLTAECAWRLGETTQDWAVPRLILCLRYETDHESVLWLASTLAHFGNHAGLEALYVVATTGDDELRSRAAGMLNALGQAAGVEHFSVLIEAWNGEVESTLEEPAPSPRHRLEIWRRIRALSEWQLRGVDDGRFILAREGAAAAALLARALADEDRYIRVHSAQCLARMGPRGAAAGPALVAALEEAGLAPEAAAALGGIRYTQGAPELALRVGPEHPLELRVAAARALGRLVEYDACDALLPLLAEAEPIDLRAAAAGTIARTAPLERVAPAARLLVELLESPAVEPSESEAALESWLARLVEMGVESAPPVLGGWRALRRGRPTERVAGRAALLREKLDQLLAE